MELCIAHLMRIDNRRVQNNTTLKPACQTLCKLVQMFQRYGQQNAWLYLILSQKNFITRWRHSVINLITIELICVHNKLLHYYIGLTAFFPG